RVSCPVRRYSRFDKSKSGPSCPGTKQPAVMFLTGFRPAGAFNFSEHLSEHLFSLQEHLTDQV
ncbi:hypothetical protein, partial [Serratia sarumanii]|uniref:hypothetical protein n=1 Tax=Serratia sarumanii TaxID=3020826 RepID=UPI003F8191D6